MAELWCSTPREISSRRWYSLLLSLQYPSVSQWNPISPYPTLLICYWLCVWVHLYEHLVFVLCFTLQWWGNVNSALPRGCELSPMIIAGKCTIRERHSLTGEKMIFHTDCLHFFFFFKQHVCNESKMKKSHFVLLSDEPLVCVRVWWNSAERPSPSSRPIFLSTDTEGLQNKGYGVEGYEMTMLTVAHPGRGMLCCRPGMCWLTTEGHNASLPFCCTFFANRLGR